MPRSHRHSFAGDRARTHNEEQPATCWSGWIGKGCDEHRCDEQGCDDRHCGKRGGVEQGCDEHGRAGCGASSSVARFERGLRVNVCFTNADSYEPPPPLFSSSTRYAYGMLRLTLQSKPFTCSDIDSSLPKINQLAAPPRFVIRKATRTGANLFACAQGVKM